MDILNAIGSCRFSPRTGWSSARSYFAKGRLAGMEEATREVIRGVRSHFDVAGQAPPDGVAKAVEAVSSFARSASFEKSIHRYQALLWTFEEPSAPPVGARDTRHACRR
jgi:hypothetical protein